MANFPTITHRQVSNLTVQTVDAHHLWRFLAPKRRYNDWVRDRVKKYGFEDGTDFYSILSKTSNRGRPRKEYHLTIDMAKELAMVERTSRGREVRRYFIECEQKLLAGRRERLAREERRLFRLGRGEGLAHGMILTMDLRRLEVSWDDLCSLVWLRVQGLTQCEAGRVVKMTEHRVRAVEKTLRQAGVSIPPAFTAPRKKRAEKLLRDLLAGPIGEMTRMDGAAEIRAIKNSPPFQGGVPAAGGGGGCCRHGNADLQEPARTGRKADILPAPESAGEGKGVAHE